MSEEQNHTEEIKKALDELAGVQEITPFTEENFEFMLKRIPRLQYGTWPAETAEEKALRELAEQYHTRCETFDQSVCTGRHPKTGEAMPITPYEFRSINANALKVRDEINRAGESMGFTDEQVTRAIQNYVKGR